MSYDQRPNTAAIQLHYERAQFTHFPWRKYCKKYSHQHKQAMHNSTLSSYFLQPRTKYLSHGWRSSIRKNLPFIERSSIPAEKYFKGHTLKFRGFFYTKGKTNSWLDLNYSSAAAPSLHVCFIFAARSSHGSHGGKPTNWWSRDDKLLLPLYAQTRKRTGEILQLFPCPHFLSFYLLYAAVSRLNTFPNAIFSRSNKLSATIL